MTQGPPPTKPPEEIARDVTASFVKGFSDQRKDPTATPWSIPDDEEAFRDLLFSSTRRNYGELTDGMVIAAERTAHAHGMLVATAYPTGTVPLSRILRLKKEVPCSTQEPDGTVRLFGKVCDF